MTALNDNSVRFRSYTFDLGKNYEMRFFEDQDKLDEWIGDIVEVAEQISVTGTEPEDIEIDYACYLPDMFITVLGVDEEEETALILFEQGEFKLVASVELDIMTEEEAEEALAEREYEEVYDAEG